MHFDFLYNQKVRGLKPTKYKVKLFQRLLHLVKKPPARLIKHQTRTNTIQKAMFVKILFNFKREMISKNIIVFANMPLNYKTGLPKITAKKINASITQGYKMMGNYWYD